ncbi:MAG: hypothetical protein IPN69_03015 [Acidobacteria bacterium]|nr:hypothetical protein [Acidobacteriota bacterium]
MQETSWFHVVTQHPIIAFLIGALIVLGLLFLIVKWADRLFVSRVEDTNSADKSDELRNR